MKWPLGVWNKKVGLMTIIKGTDFTISSQAGPMMSVPFSKLKPIKILNSISDFHPRNSFDPDPKIPSLGDSDTISL